MIKVCGEHFLENILGAIEVCLHFGLSWEQIGKGLKTLEAPEKTMQLVKRNNLLIIDDSYNATPRSFAAAIDFIYKVKADKRYIISPGLIELGKEAGRINKKLSEKMSKIDGLFLTSIESRDDFKLLNPKILLTKKDFLKMEKVFGGKNVILVEGRIPTFVRQKLNI